MSESINQLQQDYAQLSLQWMYINISVVGATENAAAAAQVGRILLGGGVSVAGTAVQRPRLVCIQ